MDVYVFLAGLNMEKKDPCPICGGRGWIITYDPLEWDLCECKKKKGKKRVVSVSNISG